jgi:hypothetical protein
MKKTFFFLSLALISIIALGQRPNDGPKKFPIPDGMRCPTFVIAPVDNINITATNLIESILGDDVTSFTLINFHGTFGANSSAGLFTGGIQAGIGIEDGIVLSSGYAINALGPNTSEGTTGILNLPGDPDLAALIPGTPLFDATVLEFSFVPDFNQLYIQFVFGSEEYNEYVGSINDVFGFFLNGQNIALVPGTNDIISINTINLFQNSNYYINNDLASGSPHCNEMDGFTTVMVATGPVIQGQPNTIKLAIADASDSLLDSWVFIKGEGFTGDPPQPPQIPLSNWALLIGIGLIVVFMVIRFKRLV